VSGLLWALQDWGEKWFELGDEHLAEGSTDTDFLVSPFRLKSAPVPVSADL
jgi:hypothetical protein